MDSYGFCLFVTGVFHLVYSPQMFWSYVPELPSVTEPNVLLLCVYVTHCLCIPCQQARGSPPPLLSRNKTRAFTYLLETCLFWASLLSCGIAESHDSFSFICSWAGMHFFTAVAPFCTHRAVHRALPFPVLVNTIFHFL